MKKKNGNKSWMKTLSWKRLNFKHVTGDHEGSMIYPVVVVVVDGIKCRALLDTGAGSSYASAALV